MAIRVNGEAQDAGKLPIILSELLKLNKVESPDMVSVQVNGQFVAKDAYAAKNITDNDEVEFIYFMGGGAGL